MKKFLALAGILIVALVLVFAFTAQADSELKWSNPDSANGTYIAGAILITNSVSSNATLVGTVTLPAGAVATASLAGNKFTGIMTNGYGSAYTSRTFIANGIVTNVSYAPTAP